MDANAYALQAADPSQALGRIIRKAAWQGKGSAQAQRCRSWKYRRRRQLPVSDDDLADDGIEDDDLDD